VFFGSLALYDAVRYGRADLVADQLGAATEDLGSPLLRAMAAHAEAQRAGDGWALDRVAESFAQMHANVLVIEAFADAARAHHDEADRNRSATLAALWQRHTPAPNALSRAAPAALTERELDVVQRTLTGESSKAIAEAEFLSVRTVDNHLGQAYRKLGVGSRDELRNALQPNPTVRTLGERRDERTAGTRFLPR